MQIASMRALAFIIASLLVRSGSPQDAITPTTLHFFPRTSCNTGTSFSYSTVADLYSDSTCHTTPTGTEALYVDGITEGCAIVAYSDSACSEPALLSQEPITAGICQFYGNGNSIGAWQGVCGATATVVNTSMPTSMSADLTGSTSGSIYYTTMTAPANMSMGTTTTTSVGMVGNGTIIGGGLASPTRTPSLQTSDVSTSGVTGLYEDDWARRMIFKALLAMGSAEIMWAFVLV